MKPPPFLQAAIEERLSKHFSITTGYTYSTVSGGSINNTYQISAGDQTIFCKINSATKFPHLFVTEVQGLTLLAAQNCIKTPAVIDCFETEGYQVLFLEWIQEGEKTDVFWKRFGEELAALHQVTNTTYGLHDDNYMGSVPQQNKPHHDWATFFEMQRLSPMIRRCAEKKLLSASHVHSFEALQQKLTELFNEEKPSLLHGDLWSGNFLCHQTGQPVLIDPAAYYGHRSVDLAMTTLFGGFRQPFYEAYHYHFPLPSNYEEQWAVCNLYPLLIHLYLFGTGYLPQIERTLKQFA